MAMETFKYRPGTAATTGLTNAIDVCTDQVEFFHQ